MKDNRFLGNSPISIVEDWDMECDDIYKNLERTPIDKMMNNNIYGNVRKTIKGLEDSKKMEQSQETQSQTTENSKKQNKTLSYKLIMGIVFGKVLKKKYQKL